jgi:hypothetical protein
MLRIDAPAKAAIGLADVVQKRQASQAGAGYRVERGAARGPGQTLIDGRLRQECRDYGGDIGRVFDQTVPTHDLLAGSGTAFPRTVTAILRGSRSRRGGTRRVVASYQ